MNKSYIKLTTLCANAKLDIREAIKFILENQSSISTFLFLPRVRISEGHINYFDFKLDLKRRYLSNPDSALSSPQIKIKVIFKRLHLISTELESYFSILMFKVSANANCALTFSEMMERRLGMLRRIGEAIFKNSNLTDAQYEQVQRLNFALTHTGYFLSEPYIPDVTEERLSQAFQLAYALELAASCLNVEAIKDILCDIKRKGLDELVILQKRTWQNALKISQSSALNLSEAKILEKIACLAPDYFEIDKQIDEIASPFLLEDPDRLTPFEVETRSYESSGYEPIQKRDLAEIYREGQCNISRFEAPVGMYKKISRKEDIKVYCTNDLYIMASSTSILLAAFGKQDFAKNVSLLGKNVEKNKKPGKSEPNQHAIITTTDSLIVLANKNGIEIKKDCMPGTRSEWQALLKKYKKNLSFSTSYINDILKNNGYKFQRGKKAGLDDNISRILKLISMERPESPLS